NNPTIKPKEEEQEIDLKQLLEQYAYYWKWFVVSVILVVGLAFLYLRYTTPQYKVDAKILLEKEDKATGELAGLAELSTLTGGSGASAFVVDQIDVLKSRRLIRKVIDQHKLNIQYFVSGTIRASEVLEKDSPVKVSLVDLDSLKRPQELSITIEGSKLRIVNKTNKEELENVSSGQNVKLKGVGRLVFAPNNNNAINNKYTAVRIILTPIERAVDDFQKLIQISPNSEKQSYIVNFSMTGPLKEKSQLVVNSLIDIYNMDMYTDKAKVTKATSTFIYTRLQLIGQDLASADKKVVGFKSANRLMDIQ